MNKSVENKIHINQTWALFIGQFNDNVLHRHYALQISIASKQQFEITDENKVVTTYSTCFINRNIRHQFKNDEISLIILINPISSIGHQLFSKYRDVQIASLDFKLKKLTDIFNAYLEKEIEFAGLIENVSDYLSDFKCDCELENHFEDQRIYKAIQYLEQHFERIVSQEEIAGLCHLSETRFLHLFKEKTNSKSSEY